jgi:hypothetical protein
MIVVCKRKCLNNMGSINIQTSDLVFGNFGSRVRTDTKDFSGKFASETLRDFKKSNRRFSGSETTREGHSATSKTKTRFYRTSIVKNSTQPDIKPIPNLLDDDRKHTFKNLFRHNPPKPTPDADNKYPNEYLIQKRLKFPKSYKLSSPHPHPHPHPTPPPRSSNPSSTSPSNPPSPPPNFTLHTVYNYKSTHTHPTKPFAKPKKGLKDQQYRQFDLFNINHSEDPIKGLFMKKLSVHGGLGGVGGVRGERGKGKGVGVGEVRGESERLKTTGVTERLGSKVGGVEGFRCKPGLGGDSERQFKS